MSYHIFVSIILSAGVINFMKVWVKAFAIKVHFTASRLSPSPFLQKPLLLWIMEFGVLNGNSSYKMNLFTLRLSLSSIDSHVSCLQNSLFLLSQRISPFLLFDLFPPIVTGYQLLYWLFFFEFYISD